ncbi:hypothetical protein [Anaeromyxobacter oryzisoli]
MRSAAELGMTRIVKSDDDEGKDGERLHRKVARDEG